MLDYVFFDRRPFERFLAYLRERGLEPVCREGDDAVFEVSLPEDLDDALTDAVEAYYDEMMAYNQALFEDGSAPGSDYHAAGVVVNLRNGEAVYAEVEPDLLARVMSVLSPEEFGRLVDAIVDAVEAPDGRSFCQRMREEGGP